MAISKSELPGIPENREITGQAPLTVFLEDPRARDVSLTGGKGASLAELRSIPEIKVPDAFVVTASLSGNVLKENPDIEDKINNLDQYSLAWIKAKLTGNEGMVDVVGARISEIGQEIEKKIAEVRFSPEAEKEIVDSYSALSRKAEKENVRVAVRSSGINEDGNEFSFAGQNKTFLHQEGKKEVIKSTVDCIASQFGARVIEYRNEARLKLAQRAMAEDKELGADEAIALSKSFSHAEARLAVVVQEMADGQGAGIGFSVDSKTGAKIARLDINYGLGEAIVSGRVTPDSYDVDPRTGVIIGRKLGEKAVKTVYVKGGTEEVDVPLDERKKFAIQDDLVKKIAKHIARVREHYGKEVDTEFVIKDGEIYFTQARPETIASKEDSMIVKMRRSVIPEDIAEKAKVILEGGITGCPGVATGIFRSAVTVEDAQRAIKETGDKKVVLGVPRTDPDWVSVMKKSNAIATEVGGQNCHASIVTRELEVPSMVGIGSMSKFAKEYDGKPVTLDAGERKIYEGILPLVEVGRDIDVRNLLAHPRKTVIGSILSNPDMARKMHAAAELGDRFKIGLLRIEFLLSEIGVHANALVDFDKVNKGEKVKNEKMFVGSELHSRTLDRISGYESGKDYFVKKLSEGIMSFAAIFPNSPITVRTTDFKTNEYANLIGGKEYETEEANPMMGWRGLIRSLCPENREAFKWELEAIKNVRDSGYRNVEMMFPVVRKPIELTGGPAAEKIGYKGAFEIMKEVGLERGKDGLNVGIMVEVPTNAIRINDFIDAGIDFISFGTNDLTQFTLAGDRDNEKIGKIPWYNESDPAIVTLIGYVIEECRKRGVKTAICGNGPSNYPEFARMLVEKGIDSISVMPDKLLDTFVLVGEEEEKLRNLGPTIPHQATIWPGGNGHGSLVQ